MGVASGVGVVTVEKTDAGTPTGSENATEGEMAPARKTKPRAKPAPLIALRRIAIALPYPSD
ncbi:hypothetical protein GCM10009861_25000 [Neomicrococcus aestuarii]